MLLTDLAAIARTTGYPVIEVPGWRTRGHGPMTDVRTIVPHHTAGPKSGDFPSLKTVRDGRPGLPGPLSQYGLGRSGTIYVVAAGLCYHAGAVLDRLFANAHAIGIEAENTGTGEPWPAVQMDAYRDLCRALCKHYGVPHSRVLGHKEVCAPHGRKSDPTFDMAAFRASLAAAPTCHPAPSKPPARPASHPVVTATERPRLVRWQKHLRVTADGIYGPTTSATDMRMRTACHDPAVEVNVRDVQRVLGVRQDGARGPLTNRALDVWTRAAQTLLGVKADGDWGATTDHAWWTQRWHFTH